MRKSSPSPLTKSINLFIALVWVINGLFCKVLNLVPRHQLIVARILGEEHAFVLTKTIGVLEVLMAAWVLTRTQSRLCTITQVLLVATMNMIEYILAPDLLLFGRMNVFVAAVFVGVLIINESLYNRNKSSPNFSH
jgi:hypothetical protein